MMVLSLNRTTHPRNRGVLPHTHTTRTTPATIRVLPVRPGMICDTHSQALSIGMTSIEQARLLPSRTAMRTRSEPCSGQGTEKTDRTRAGRASLRTQGAWVMKISDTGDQNFFTSVICRARPISRLRHCVPPLRSKVFTNQYI